jgi:predicted MFS family arabinose efflux permease
MFAILMAFTNIGQGIGMYLSGALSDGIGFSNTFLVLTGLNLLILPLVMLVFKAKAPKVEMAS